MRKINIWVIILDHLLTLRDDSTGRLSVPDILVFYGAPVLCGVVAFLFEIAVADAAVSAIIAVFSVFSALLFSAKIALYGMAPKRGELSTDEIQMKIDEAKYLREMDFFGSVNSNISYLILLSCFSLTVFVVSLFVSTIDRIEGAILITLSLHFVLTLTMLVKRTHVAFAIRYSTNS